MILSWEFKTHLISGSDIIRMDSLGGYTIDTGIGISMDIIHNDVFRFSLHPDLQA